MSITFACGHCGKSFTVPNKHGGKLGRCKQCNAVMPIPEPVLIASARATRPRPAPAPVPHASSGLPRPARVVPPSRPVLPKQETYFTPQPEPAPRRQEAFEVLPTRAVQAPGVWYKEPRTRRKYDGPSDAATAAGLLAIRIVAGLVAFFMSLCFFTGNWPTLKDLNFTMPSLPGLAAPAPVPPPAVAAVPSNDAYEKLYQDQINTYDNLAALLSRVHDVASAQVESDNANIALRKLISIRKQFMELKNPAMDYFLAEKKYEAPSADAQNRYLIQFYRLLPVRDVWQALKIDDAIQELGGRPASGKPGSTPPPAPYQPPSAPYQPPSQFVPPVRRPNGTPSNLPDWTPSLPGFDRGKSIRPGG